MNFDSALVRSLRDHLLGLAQHSIIPRDPAGRPARATPEEAAVLERFEPFAELLFLVTDADGTVSDVERATILGAFRALTGGRVSPLALEGLEQELADRRRRHGRMSRLEAACTRLALNREDAELAFTLANAVALADRSLLADEEALLEQLSDLLGVSSKRFDALVESSRASQLPPPP
ncbi:MAG TPA: TerB family tellurite resistance protein [Polyangiaceae bacterium]|nr:TerB family tellurite resistance protein [Polyangiaceae bacterium]